MEPWVLILQTLAAGFASWAAVKVELRYISRSVDRAHQRIDDLLVRNAGEKL